MSPLKLPNEPRLHRLLHYWPVSQPAATHKSHAIRSRSRSNELPMKILKLQAGELELEPELECEREELSSMGCPMTFWNRISSCFQGKAKTRRKSQAASGKPKAESREPMSQKRNQLNGTEFASRRRICKWVWVSWENGTRMSELSVSGSWDKGQSSDRITNCVQILGLSWADNDRSLFTWGNGGSSADYATTSSRNMANKGTLSCELKLRLQLIITTISSDHFQ